MPTGTLSATNRGARLRHVAAAALLLCFAAARAAPVQIVHDGLRLNGELESAQTSPGDGKPIFLIVHGTWAYHGMEIIQALQSVLAENGYPSLAITLSLGVDDRRAPLRCEAPIVARHDAAVPEMAAWLNKLKADGWSDVVLSGHSRGGAQVALAQQRLADPAVRRLLLLAPMVWRAGAVAADYDTHSTTRLQDVLAEARAAQDRETGAGDSAPRMGPHPLLYCDTVQAAPQSFLSYYGTSVPKHTPAIVAELGIPVDVYLGTEDDLARWSPEERSAATRRAGVTLHDIEGADHFFRDLYLYEVVEDFLDRLP